MTSRTRDIPIYEHRDSEIAAEHYNIVQIALKRIDQQIRFELPKLRTLDLILDHEEWLVVDHDLNDIPIVAWRDFDVDARSNLHEPIKCSLNLYHAQADIILDKVIEAMNLILGEKLSDDFLEENNIIDLSKRRKSIHNDNSD